MELLDKLELAGGSNATSESLLLFDKELEKHIDEADLARDASVEKP